MSALIKHLSLPPALPHLLNRSQYATPGHGAVDVIFFKEQIGTLGSSQRRILAVLLDQQLGDSVDVGVGGYWITSAAPARRERLG